ncbi:MAG: NAD(P)/FAD-dependent oxidoreductase, partial [Akkermansiaceae bacterium]|nr:NAD(P)/FAD-dependent oxidoreductase [Verrucomicrobiales bacterium]
MSSSAVYDFDVAVIGGGSGGYAAARTAAGEGLKTVVLEGGEEVGGLCILRGCMPTKALLHAAAVMHLVSHPEAFGIRTEGVTFDFAKVMARKNALIKDFADYRSQQLGSGKFEFLRTHASFVDDHTLELTPPANASASGGKRQLTAKHFVISTGSKVAPSPLPQLDEMGYLTSDTALELTRLPRSIIVLGAGAVGLEFAQFFARFGVKTTVIQRSPHVLQEMDSDAAKVVESVFQREGITVYTGTKLTDARRLGSSKEILFEHKGETKRVLAEEIFFAMGRVPNVAPLKLDKLGVELEHGRIRTNRRLQTTLPHIYAAGDCTG